MAQIALPLRPTQKMLCSSAPHILLEEACAGHGMSGIGPDKVDDSIPKTSTTASNCFSCSVTGKHWW